MIVDGGLLDVSSLTLSELAEVNVETALDGILANLPTDSCNGFNNVI